MREDTHLAMLAVMAGKAGSAQRFLMTGDGSKTVFQGECTYVNINLSIFKERICISIISSNLLFCKYVKYRLSISFSLDIFCSATISVF